MNREVFVLGTAHISRQSVVDVENYIKYYRPDVICVELCESRYRALFDKDRWKKLDIVQVVRQRKIYLLLSSVILSSFQKKMGEHSEVSPGQEMITAIALAKKYNIRLALVDRDIQLTLKRAMQSIGYMRKMLLFSELLSSLLVKVEMEDDDIEELKKKDVLEDVFDNLPGRYGKVKEVIITERDKYLAQKIKMATEKSMAKSKIFAVVGAGHLRGIKKHFERHIALKALETIKSKSKIWSAIKFLVPLIAIFTIFFIYTKPGKMAENMLAWVVIKCATVAFFSTIIWLHPLAILAATVLAPISNLNPVLKSGWAAALIEAKYRKPTVEDFDSISTDTSSFMGLFRNKVMRVFWALTLPQTGSFIANLIVIGYWVK